MQVPEGVEDYCTTYADCAARFPDAMTKWDAFFQVHAMHTHTGTEDKMPKDHCTDLTHQFACHVKQY